MSVMSVLCVSAQSINYGNYTGTQKLENWGTSKAETYSVAMKVSQPSMEGMKAIGLRIPMNAAAKNITDCSAFLTKELKATSGKATGDILNLTFTQEGEWTTVKFSEPYTLTAEPFYCGYTFKVAKVEDTNDARPVKLMVGVCEEGLEVISSRTYRKWSSLSETIGGSLPIQLIVEGDIPSEAVGVAKIEDKSIKIGQAGNIRVRLVNHGSKAVSNVTYTYSIAGQEVEHTTDVVISADCYGAAADIEVETPVITQNGTYEGVLAITKVNGKDNVDKAATAKNTIRVSTVVPHKLPLMEEFTGAWCGFCPAGYVSMKLMNERHPGDFICASYHNGDAMEITQAYPVKVEGFPSANLDRSHATDPYLGDTKEDMGIEKTWQQQCLLPTTVNVQVRAYLDKATGNLDVIGDVIACEDVDGVDYGIAYIITADGMIGNSELWVQHNYFSPGYSGGAYSYTYTEGMEMFNEGAEYQLLEYDDVVVAQSGSKGAVIDGVIPANIKEAETYSHMMTFNTADMVSSMDANIKLSKYAKRMHAIMLVYDKQGMKVINCNRCEVETDLDAADALQSIALGSNAQSVYSLSGQHLPQMQKGINIVRCADGKMRKVIKK